MPETSQTVVSELSHSILTLRLNRPEVLNAFHDEMLSALSQALRKGERDKNVRCLVITGAGRAFSSGQDLAAVRERYSCESPVDFAAHLRDHYNPIITRIRAMEKPVIASINGVAAGAGSSLALACDVRIAAQSASFIQSFINVGLIPDSGATFMLPRLIGPARAMELAFTGRKVSAEEALQIGLVNQVVADEQLAEATLKLAQTLASLPTRGIGLAKRAINASWNNELQTQLDYEAMLQATAGQTRDHREGVTAFLEKRKPQFLGE